jgi:hypothetical protein
MVDFDGPFVHVRSFTSKRVVKRFCREVYSYSAGQVKIKMQVYRAKPQLYYLMNQLHVSATVGSHHQANQNNVKERRNMLIVGPNIFVVSL